MRQRSSFKLFSINRRYFLFTLLLVVVFSAAAILFSFYFSVRSIRVITTKDASLKGLSELEHINIFFHTSSSLEERLKSQNPTLKGVKIIKQYPDTLIITPQFRDPFAQFKVNGGYYVLSDDHIILERKRTKSSLPVIQYYQQFAYASYNPGENLSMTDLDTSLFFLDAIREAGLACDRIDINSLDMIVCNILNKKILLTTKKDKTMQRYELQTILRQFKIEGKEFQTLDVRFDKPVVTF